MKLTIFLDIGGVLNHEPATKDCGDAQKMVGDKGWVILCPKCIERLNQLIVCAYTEARYESVKLVCSSTWRRYFDPKALTVILGAFGLNYQIDDRTVISAGRRGDQILDYIAAFPTDAYIVLDDDTYDMYMVRKRHVITKYRTGFDGQAQSEAIKLLLET